DLLGRQYGDSADEIVAFTQRLEDQSNFSDEAARSAALQTASLAKNYQFTADQIETLITRSADLVQTQGRDLGDTTERLNAALRGEAESAEALGLVLNDSAVAAFAASQGITNYSTGLSAAEQAQVRFQFLLQQTNDVQGAAQEAATGTAGALANLKGYALDAAAGLGDLLGPLAPIASELGNIAPALPVVGAGLGKLATSARVAQVGTAALALAAGPVGLALAAGAAVVGLVELARAGDDHTATAKDEEAATRSLTQALLELQAAGADDSLLRGAGQTRDDIQTVINAGALLRGELAAIQERVNEAPPTPALVNALNLTDEAVRRFTLSDAQMAQVMEDGNAIIAYQGENLENVSAAVREATRDYNMGRIGADGFARRLDQIASNLNTYGVVLRETTEGTRTQAAAFRDVTGALDAHEASLVRSNKQSILWETQAGRVTAAQQRGAEMLGSLGNAYGEATAANEQMVADLQAEEEAARELAATFQSALIPGIDGASAALAGLAGPGADALDVLRTMVEASSGMQAAMQDLGDSALFRADDLNDTAETMDRVLSRFETLDALGQRSEAAASIAENLVGSPGEWAVVDDLLQNGRISLQEYNAAVDDGSDLMQRSGAIQDNLNTIRAKQLPLLDQAAIAYQDEIEHIAALAPQQQALALAYLDTANQQKLMELSSLAAAAAAGELGTNGVEAANTIAQAALDADPALKALALDAGLATQDREGKITLNTEGADTAINELTRSIDALTTTLGGVPPVRVPVEVGEVDLTLPQGTAIDPLKAPVEVGNVDLSIPAGLAIDPLKAPVVLDVPSTTELAAMLPPSPPPIEAKVRILGDDGQFQDVMGRTNLAVDDFGNKVTSTAITADNGQLVEVVYDSEGRLLTIGGMAVTPQMLADNSILVTQYDASMGLLSILDGSTGTVLYQGDATGAINAGGQAAAARNNVDGTGATIYIRGDNSGVYAAANAVNGAVLGTAYIAIRGIRSGFQEFAHGGTVLPTAANGRTSFLTGEYGPEIVSLPSGAQVTPHGASMSALASMRGRIAGDTGALGEDAAEAFHDALTGTRMDRDVERAFGAVGDAVGAGTVAGIGRSIPLTTDAADRMIADTIVAAKVAGGIASPADETIPVGYALGEGVAVGLEQSLPLVQQQADAVVGVAIQAKQQVQAIWEEIDIGNAVNFRNTQTGAVQTGIRAEDNSYVNPDFYRHLGEGIERNPAGGLRVIRGSMFEMWQKYLRETGHYDAAHNFDWFKRAYPHGYAHGGTAWGDGRTLVGEYGAEMLKLPSGAQVTPHGASMSKLESDRGRTRGREGGNVIFNGTVNLQPASTN
ncbi:MAG: hypothetical protein M3R02_27270, partial [Chloroflexota bacterium]|nr:hypothetical protein [Chloroflexota bacterium]